MSNLVKRRAILWPLLLVVALLLGDRAAVLAGFGPAQGAATGSGGGGGAPSGPAGGDLTGTYPNPTLAASAKPWTLTGSVIAPTVAGNQVSNPLGSASSESFGNGALAVNTGNFNASYGNGALGANTTGFQCTAIGWNAGLQGGFNPANKNISGQDNTYIGCATGPNSGTQRTNQTVIGSGAMGTADNQVTLGNSSVTTIHLANATSSLDWATSGDISALSSATFAVGSGAGLSDGVAALAGFRMNVVSSTSGTIDLPLASTHNNVGAGGSVTFRLPLAPPVGTTEAFRVVPAQNLVIQASNGVTVYFGTTAAPSGGTWTSNSPGSTVTVEYQGSATWVATQLTGTWTHS